MKYHNLIIGKFLPLHQGHCDLIWHSLRSNSTTVVVLPKSGEQYSGEQRVQWIKETFRDRNDLRVVNCPINIPDPTSERSWQVWVNLLKRIAPNTTHLVSAEEYGEILANKAGWEHIQIEKRREICGTACRIDLLAGWEHIPNSVKRSLVKKIAIVGAESTGKSTLAERLAKYFKTEWVPEFGREYSSWKNDDILNMTFEDFRAIASAQKNLEDQAAELSTGIIFCDTENIVTQAWAYHVLGIKSENLLFQSGYELYAVTSNAVPWRNDGTRVYGTKRDSFRAFILNQVAVSNTPFIELPSNEEDCFHVMVNLLGTMYNIRL